ncbi:MAG: DNA adenine methylase [Dethiosulfatibacter sp.]|nr:DNA adenine methylase [Dethiosulfatibacter sp.]
MDKYIGNKKVIVDGIADFIKSKGITEGVIIDAFSGTTNVGQYFKQQGFSIISNDINPLSYVLGKVYIENNEFPKFSTLLDHINKQGFTSNPDEIVEGKKYIERKITSEKLYSRSYFDEIDYGRGIEPLLKVLEYLNNIPLEGFSEEEMLFYNYYTVWGEKSEFRSSRGTEGKRNYFSAENALRLGKIMQRIKTWNENSDINQMEMYILLACVIEEVTLNANVNGTFHDFNRSKLYPNAEARLYLKPIMFNIYNSGKAYKVFNEDANLLHKNQEFKDIDISNSILYIDPPYNFRQYSAYYHLLNFLAIFHTIEDILEYAEGFEYVRGQNMKDNVNSRYCYRERFIEAMSELLCSIDSKHVLISYYDENNHWNHGKEIKSFEGRNELLNLLKTSNFEYYDETPSTIERQNYQSQNGANKKKIEELLFYARR